MKHFNVKKLVLCLIASVAGLMSVLALLFPILKLAVSTVSVLSSDGFSYFLFAEDQFFGEYTLYSSIIGVLAIISLVIAIVAIVFAVLSFVKEDRWGKFSLVSIILATVGTCVYMGAGIFAKIEMDVLIDGSYLAGYSGVKSLLQTEAFVPFIIVAILLVGYIVCLKFIADNDVEYAKEDKIVKPKNKYAKYTEEMRIRLLLQYKELLDKEVITKEEFETKKDELLMLKEVAVAHEPIIKRTSEEIKIDNLIKYKKLLDDKVIDTDDYSEVKHRLL